METKNIKEWWQQLKLWDIVKWTTWKLDSNAMIENWMYPYFTCSQETFRINEYAFDQEAVLLWWNNAAWIFPLKYYKWKFNAYQRTYVMSAIDNEVLDNKYLYYALIPELISFKNMSTWATTKFLTKGILDNFEITLPLIQIQKYIAWFLSNYDNLIENNNRRIQILEQTAQEIYKEWFVNFRFPWHETIKLIDSGSDFWEIPEGWNIENLWDRIKILKWKNITRSTITPWDIPVVAWWISPAYYHNKPNVNWPVITISASGANAGYIRLYHQDIWASDCSYISKDNSKFIYSYFLLLKDKQINITNLQVGSAQPHVYPKDIISFKAIVPNNDIIADFETKITPIFHELSNLENQNNNLIKTRDLLLPKLISWEIDVSELEIL